MNCKKCGAPLMENDQFCKNCGAPVETLSAQNNMMDAGQAPTITSSEFNQGQQPINNTELNSVATPTINNAPNPVVTEFNNPALQQPVDYQNSPVMTVQKNGNKSMFIMIGIIVAAIIIAVALVFVLGGNKKDSGNKNVENEKVETKSTYTVTQNGFTYKIPTDLVYETDGDAIILGDEEGTWVAYIETASGSYSQLIANKGNLAPYYQQRGYTVKNVAEKTIGGMDFLTAEFSISGENALIAYAKANSMNVFSLEVVTLDNDFGYDVLENITSVLSSAEMVDSTNNMSTFERVDLTGVLSAQ